ncbi:hypothetical protein [Haloarcula montana]|uniref:hypothetical protein n=1 Tax=Haloarcula montana TaxID=3111776 RepID=UPI002D7868C7|nr:hypothetical protein [Haloarcula sp. GH36]
MGPSLLGDDSDVDDLLDQRRLDAYLGSDEQLFHLLTNRRVGVERTEDGDTTQVTAGEDCGAVAALTDRRVLLLVGDPPARSDGDYVASLPYADVDEAEAVTELLTARLQFETSAGAIWEFTAREADIDEVADFLQEACGVWGEVRTALDTLSDHCDALADALESADWTAFDQYRADAETALETAREGADAAPFDGVEDRIDRLETDLYRLVRDRNVVRGEELLAEARRMLDDRQYEESYDRVRTARERFQDATDVATTHDIDDEAAQEGLAAATELATTVAERPLTTARDAHERAETVDDPTERVAALEGALDSYRAVAQLVAGGDSPFEGGEETARAESEAVIADLIEALLASARERRRAGDWEWDAGNEETAYDLLSSARDDLDRALELAEEFPPGDPESIRRTREELTDHFDVLAIRYEVARANAELQN